ncbi:hypothetical protein [Streptomyces fagopyri]|uniref:hypothetical protein n=1 Tax=Streptomyces fagopyri TaxID=2662397 RepID=UPI0033F592D6
MTSNARPAVTGTGSAAARPARGAKHPATPRSRRTRRPDEPGAAKNRRSGWLPPYRLAPTRTALATACRPPGAWPQAAPPLPNDGGS